MFLPGTDCFDIFAPHLRGIDFQPQPDDLDDDPDLETFSGLMKRAEGASWRAFASTASGSDEGDARFIATLVGTDAHAFLVAQNFHVETSESFASWERFFRTNGTEHSMRAESFLHDNEDGERSVFVTLSARILPVSWQVLYEHTELIEVAGLDLTRAKSVRSIVRAMENLETFRRTDAGEPVVTQAEEFLARLEGEFTELFSVPVPAVAKLEAFVRNFGFSAEEARLICRQKKLPARLYRSAQWTARINDDGRITVERTDGDVPFLRGPPSRGNRDEWLADAKSVATRTRGLGNAFWTHRDALLAKSTPL